MRIGSNVENAFRLLRERSVPSGVVVILSSRNIRRVREILNYLRDSGAKTVRLNPVAAIRDSPLDVTSKEYSLAIAAAWQWQYENPETSVVNVVELEMSLLGLDWPSTCSCSPCQAGRRVVAADVSGHFYPCARYIGSTEHLLPKSLLFREDGTARRNVPPFSCPAVAARFGRPEVALQSRFSSLRPRQASPEDWRLHALTANWGDYADSAPAPEY